MRGALHVPCPAPGFVRAPCCWLLSVAAQAHSSTPTPVTGEDNPINDQGSNYNYRSYITGVTPSVPGVSCTCWEFADRLILTNHSGQTVTVIGYQGEPYGRVLADGTVSCSTRARPPTTSTRTSTATSKCRPRRRDRDSSVDRARTAPVAWNGTIIASTGCLPVLPPQVKDKGQAHQDLRLAGADPGGRSQKATVDGELSGARAVPRRPPPRSRCWWPLTLLGC